MDNPNDQLISKYPRNEKTPKTTPEKKQVPSKPTIPQTPQKEQGYPLRSDETPSYNLPGRIDTCNGCDFFIFGCFLYWKTQEDGLALGYESFHTPDGGVDTSNNRRLISMDFEYKPGVRVGQGIPFNRDDWSLILDWTSIRSIQKRSFSTSNNIFSLWAITQRDIESIRANWKLKYNILNLYLSRHYYTGKYLIFNAFFGLKGGWLDQRYDITYIVGRSDLSVTTNMKSNSWLVGPRLMFDTQWLLGYGLKFIANLGATIFYQKYSSLNMLRTNNDLNTVQHFSTINRIDHIRPNLEANIGLAWGSYLCNKSYHINFAASYETQYYWRQNQIRDLETSLVNPNAIVTGTESNGDLALHGLTFDVRLNY